MSIVREKLEDSIRYLTKKYCDIWWELCRKEIARSGKTSNYWIKRTKQLRTDNFLNKFTEKIKSYPAIASKKIEWKNDVNLLIDKFMKEIEFINPSEIKFLLSNGILETSSEFIREARAFDNEMRIEDIGQAMRNVWIMNITQLLLSQSVKCTPSVFAYSMLYPYTDNYIDDECIDPEEKRIYSIRFEEKLMGKTVIPFNRHEEKIFSLVELIEAQYDRNSYPSVFESLLEIHRAQGKSILQHGEDITPYDMDILGVSLRKGGISVLADAFLVKGNLNSIQMEFFFIYGIMLQLCDDLQDVSTDIKNNHNTIFSLTANSWTLDRITDSLFNFVDYVLEFAQNLNVENLELFKNIIRDNCYLLIFFAIAKNCKFYSKEYLNSIKPYLPYNIRYIKKFNRHLSRKYTGLKPSYNGIETEKIIFEAIRSLLPPC